jgi:Recombinase
MPITICGRSGKGDIPGCAVTARTLRPSATWIPSDGITWSRALESRAKAQRATGGRAYGYRDGKVDRGEAFMVLEIFGKFADGMSARTIAADFNARRIPSPGASWKRTQRRAAGWMGSAIRVIVRNERYRGGIHWNTSEWRKDPDSGMRKRVMRPPFRVDQLR